MKVDHAFDQVVMNRQDELDSLDALLPDSELRGKIMASIYKENFSRLFTDNDNQTRAALLQTVSPAGTRAQHSSCQLITSVAVVYWWM